MKLATLCYVKKDGKTLMLHRNKREGDIHQGKWNGLGGKIHLGETPEECVIREVKEESGLTIKNPSLRGIITFPAFKDEEDWYVYVFVAHEFSGELTNSPEGELKWTSDEKLLNLPLWEGDPVFLKWLEQGHFFSGKFVYRNGQFIKYDVRFHDWQRPPMPVLDRFKKGIELFNNEQFFECHEVFEDIWRGTNDAYKDFYKGIIQTAVALHHLKKRNIRGACRLFQTSLQYLDSYRPKTLGIDVEKLTQDMEICFNSFTNAEGKEEYLFKEELIPKLVLEE